MVEARDREDAEELEAVGVDHRVYNLVIGNRYTQFKNAKCAQVLQREECGSLSPLARSPRFCPQREPPLLVS